MRRIRGLLVEDDPLNIEPIQISLDLVFRNFENWKTEWTICESAVKARKVISDSPDYDFAIIDMGLGEGLPDGVSVAVDLLSKSEHTFVLLLTGNPHRFADIVTGVRDTGAHAIIRRQLNDENGEWSFAQLGHKIRQHLIAHKRLQAGGVEYDEHDVGIASIIASLAGPSRDTQRGLTIMSNLVLRCLASVDARSPKFKLSYLAPGRSGAYVCRVDMSETGQPTQRFVLKIGLDRKALEAEVAANREAAKALREQALVSIIGDVRTHDQYSAVVARLADETHSLGSWLIDGATAKQARDVANVLFAEELSRLSKDELRSEMPIEDWLPTRTVTRLRVRTTLDRMAEILAHPQGANRSDAGQIQRDIEGFTNDGTLAVARRERLRGPVVTVRGFGDLHSSNVLVQTGVHPRPVLIDASLYDQYHWGADTARLLVDLHLRVRRPGLPSMLWDDFEESVQRAAELCPLCDTGEFRAGTPVDQFLDQVITRMSVNLRFEALGVPAQAWHWQWHVALAKEFLRQGCHPDLTVPRASLALVSGWHHLRQAQDLINELRY